MKSFIFPLKKNLSIKGRGFFWGEEEFFGKVYKCPFLLYGGKFRRFKLLTSSGAVFEMLMGENVLEGRGRGDGSQNVVFRRIAVEVVTFRV